LNLKPFDPSVKAAPDQPGTLSIVPVALTEPCIAGQLNPANATYVLKTLDHAIRHCQYGDFDAMVTGPVHKGNINDAGIPFTGHTEYLAEKCGTALTVMMLATEGLRVALATTRLLVRAIPDAITQPLLTDIIDILESDLRYS